MRADSRGQLAPMPKLAKSVSGLWTNVKQQSVAPEWPIYAVPLDANLGQMGRMNACFQDFS
jgi:hypothetical protein